MLIDGDVQTSGNKSILANDFTQIINDGIGVHVKNRGRCELVSVFTYYNDKAFFAESGGFVRALNSSMAYGEFGAYADGTDPDETPVTVLARGQMVEHASNLGTGQTVDIGDTVRGQSSNAFGTVIGYIADTKRIHLENIVGTFTQGETIQIEDPNSTFYTNTLSATAGDSTSANFGQIGKLFRVDSSDGTLGTAGGSGYVIEFAGEVIQDLSVEQRMTICNMTIEGGARAGLIAPDEKIFKYLKDRPFSPKKENLDAIE